MATGKINPAFQAAPFYGKSSFDPNEFMQRYGTQKLQLAKRQQDEQARDTAKGLENLMLDVKGWEDQQGFQEILRDQNKIMNGYLDLSKKGMNLVSPKTAQEIMAYKAINDAHQELKQKVDTWTQQKGIYDLYAKAIQQDSALPEDQQKIDRQATMANIQKVLQGKDIMSRGQDLQNLVVTKAQPIDIFKDIEANAKLFEKGTQTQHVIDMPDGSKQIQMEDKLTPEQTESNARKAGLLFESKPQSYKDAVRKIREADPDPTFNVMSDKDYFKTIAVPTYRNKFIRKTTGASGSGSGLSIFGQKVTTPPVAKNVNTIRLGDRDYTEHYDFNISKPFLGISMSDLGAEVYQYGKWEPAGKEGGLVSAQLNFYDPKTDSFIFTSTGDVDEAGVYKKQTFSVPRENLGKEVDNLPIKKDDGKIGKLSDIYGQSSSTPKVKTIKGMDFRIKAPLKDANAYKGKYDNM